MFIRVRSGLLERTKLSPGSFGFPLVHSWAPRCRRVHSGSRGFTLARIVVAEFNHVCVGVLWRA